MKVLIFASCVFVVPAIGQTNNCDTLEKCQEAIKVTRNSSLAHYRSGEILLQNANECQAKHSRPARPENCKDYQSAANEFRLALAGDLQPTWIEVWAHINLGKAFDVTGQRERALNEYRLARRTKDNTRGAQDEATKYTESPFNPSAN